MAQASFYPKLFSIIIFVCINVGMFKSIQRRNAVGLVLAIVLFFPSFLALLYEFGFPFP